jgi:hypothetical protein
VNAEHTRGRKTRQENAEFVRGLARFARVVAVVTRGVAEVTRGVGDFLCSRSKLSC